MPNMRSTVTCGWPAPTSTTSLTTGCVPRLHARPSLRTSTAGDVSLGASDSRVGISRSVRQPPRPGEICVSSRSVSSMRLFPAPAETAEHGAQSRGASAGEISVRSRSGATIARVRRYREPESSRDSHGPASRPSRRCARRAQGHLRRQLRISRSRHPRAATTAPRRARTAEAAPDLRARSLAAPDIARDWTSSPRARAPPSAKSRRLQDGQCEFSRRQAAARRLGRTQRILHLSQMSNNRDIEGAPDDRALVRRWAGTD